jgi:hypothetical protein
MNVNGGRTALALAFGEHPGDFFGARCRADREFFRSRMTPFLEEQVLGNGKRAIMIHEFNVGFNLAGADRHDRAQAEMVGKLVEKSETDANAMFAASLDAGRPVTGYGGWFDWGHTECIAETNRMRPGAIRNIVEPQGASTVWRLWDQMCVEGGIAKVKSFDERVAVEKEIIRHSIGICLERSRRLASLVKAFRAANPNLAIAITRGYAHQGMAGEFDQSEFEVISSSGTNGAPHFPSEAIIESFRRELGEDELARYARLSLRFDDYLAANRKGILKDSRMDGEAPMERVWALHKRARAYALSVETAGQ